MCQVCHNFADVLRGKDNALINTRDKKCKLKIVVFTTAYFWRIPLTI
jgi:hypothetical protein